MNFLRLDSPVDNCCISIAPVCITFQTIKHTKFENILAIYVTNSDVTVNISKNRMYYIPQLLFQMAHQQQVCNKHTRIQSYFDFPCIFI